MKLIRLIPLTRFISTIVLALTVCVLSGCNKRYNTFVAPDEGITKNSAVTVDGRRAGEVKQVQVKDGQLVAEFDVDRSAEGQIRHGIVRVRNGNLVDLRTTTVDASAQPLPAGAFIPVQSALQHNVIKYTHNRIVLIVAGAFVVAALLAVFFARAFKSGLVLVGLLLFSTVSALLLHPMLTPYVERLYATTGVSATGTQPTSTTTVQALQSKLQAILASRPDPEIVAFIAALLASLVLIACVIGLIKRAFVFGTSVCSMVWLTILCLSAATVAAAPTGVSYTRDRLAGEQSVARHWLTDAGRDSDSAERLLGGGLIREAAEELALASFQLDRADVSIEGHADRISSLKSSPFAYVRNDEQRKLSANYSSVLQQLRDNQERITTLHKLCGSTNTQAAALNIYLVKRQEYRNRIREGFSEGSVVLNELRQLSAFPFALVRAGIVTSENVALCRLNSDGSVQLPTGEAVLPDGKAKPNADGEALSQLKQETQELRLRMEELRRTQTGSNDLAITALKKLELRTSELNQTVNRLRAEQTNLVSGFSSRVEQAPTGTQTKASGNSSTMSIDTASASRMQTESQASSKTNRAGEQITQTVASITITLPANTVATLPASVATPTNTLQSHSENASRVEVAKTNDATTVFASSAKENASNSESTGRPVNLNHASETSPVTAGIHHIRTKPPGPKFTWLILAIFAVLTLSAAIAFALAYVDRRQREFEIVLTCSTGGRVESITIPLDPCEQCVLLSGEKPALESRGADDGRPCIIIRTFGGAVLRPGSSRPVLLNGEPLLRPTRLYAGNAIQIGAGERSRTFTFQGGSFTSPDEQATSLESATTTIS